GRAWARDRSRLQQGARRGRRAGRADRVRHGQSHPDHPFRRPNPTIAPYAQPIIAGERLRYVGEPVAMVLADSADLAEDALAEIRLDIEPLPPLLDRAACL